MTTVRAPDGGWGWLVVLVTFISTFLCGGSTYSFGVIYAALLEAFGKTSAATAWVGSIANLVFALATPVGVLLARWFGHRKAVMFGALLATVGFLSSAFVTNLYQLYITFGVLVSSGGSIAYISCVEMIGRYFEKKLAMALGLAMAGTGAGQLVLSFACQLLVDSFGWRGMLMMMSAVTSHLFISGALLKPLTAAPRQNESPSVGLSEKSNEKNTSGQASGECGRKRPQKAGCQFFNRRLFLNSLICQPVFLLHLIILVGQAIAVRVFVVHAVKHARDIDIPNTLSSAILSAMGLAQLVGRPLFGVIGNSQKVKPYALYCSSMVICGVALIGSIYAKSIAGQLVVILLFGVCSGGSFVCTPIVIAFFHGKDMIGVGLSFTIQVHGLVGLLFPPLAGWMRDMSGDYKGAFWLAAVSCFLAAVFALILPLVDSIIKRRHMSKQKGSHQQEDIKA